MRPAVTPHEIARNVRDARSGSQAAFEWLYRTFSPLVHSIHLGMTSRARAEELTQDTFLAAFGKLDQLRADDRFGPWLAAIARRHLPAASAFEVELSEADDQPSAATPPDAVAEARAALAAIRALPVAYRETLLLRLVEGLSGPEIAALTGLTPRSVRVNLHRGMAKLRRVLGIAPQFEETADE
jgi:RNA polymerase sigma-70 factor (ECF subfamily)